MCKMNEVMKVMPFDKEYKTCKYDDLLSHKTNSSVDNLTFHLTALIVL